MTGGRGISVRTAQPFDARCVCPTHGWPPDLMASIERLRDVAHAARAVLQDSFAAPIDEVGDHAMNDAERHLRDLLVEHRRVIQ